MTIKSFEEEALERIEARWKDTVENEDPSLMLEDIKEHLGGGALFAAFAILPDRCGYVLENITMDRPLGEEPLPVKNLVLKIFVGLVLQHLQDKDSVEIVRKGDASLRLTDKSKLN